MSDSYENIPDAPGRHPGDTSGHETGMSVRAENPPAPERSGQPAHLYQLSYHAGRGEYRVRAWQPDRQPPGQQEGYAERGRYTSSNDLVEALENLPQQERYVVFENTGTGRVVFQQEKELSGNWTSGGDFDQVTIFASEDAAATYAERRQRELGKDGSSAS